MSVDEIQNLTVTVDRALKMVANEVKAEIQTAKAAPWSFEKREKEILLEKLDEKINIGIEEASILMSLSQYISLLEEEKVKYSLQIDRLKLENEWLLEEKQLCEKKLQDVHESFNELTNDRDMSRAAFVLRKNNPASCDRIVSEFSKIMSAPEGHEEVMDPEVENFFSSKVQALYYLSIQCVKHNEFGLAKLLVNRMLEKIISNEGNESPDVGSLYEILAMISRREGNLDESLNYLKKSLKIRETCFGKDSAQVSLTLNNMSICQCKMNSFKDAFVTCSRAIAIKENIHGRESPEVAKQLHNLALICTYLGKFSEAHRYFQKALIIHKVSKPFDEEKMLKTQNSIAMCHLRQNNIAEAQSIIFSLIDRYHERLLHHQPSLPHEPSIHMIVDMYPKEKRKAINVLNLVYGSVCVNELSLVIKNLITLYRKQKQENKMEIIQEWIQKKTKARYKRLGGATFKQESLSPGEISQYSQRTKKENGSGQNSESKRSLQISSTENTDDTCTTSKRDEHSTSRKEKKTKNPFSYIFKKKP